MAHGEDPFEIETQSLSRAGDVDLHRSVERGHMIVAGVIATMMVFSVGTIVLFVAMAGPERLPEQVVRFALTLGLCIALYRGQGWARGLIAVLCGLGAILGVTNLPAIFEGGDPLFITWISLMILAYAVLGIVLITSPSVDRFLKSQRNK